MDRIILSIMSFLALIGGVSSGQPLFDAYHNAYTGGTRRNYTCDEMNRLQFKNHDHVTFYQTNETCFCQLRYDDQFFQQINEETMVLYKNRLSLNVKQYPFEEWALNPEGDKRVFPFAVLPSGEGGALSINGSNELYHLEEIYTLAYKKYAGHWEDGPTLLLDCKQTNDTIPHQTPSNGNRFLFIIIGIIILCSLIFIPLLICSVVLVIRRMKKNSNGYLVNDYPGDDNARVKYSSLRQPVATNEITFDRSASVSDKIVTHGELALPVDDTVLY